MLEGVVIRNTKNCNENSIWLAWQTEILKESYFVDTSRNIPAKFGSNLHSALGREDV